MRKILFVLFAIIFMTACSSDNKDEAIETKDIVGKWNVYAYLNSDNYFTDVNDSSYYEFKANNTCVYYSGDIIDSKTEYTYTYDFNKDLIECKHEKGWNINIQVEEKNNETIFHVVGKTANSNSTVKVRK